MKNEETEAASCRSEKVKQLLFTSVNGYRVSHYFPERINKRKIQFYTVEIALCYLCFFSCLLDIKPNFNSYLKPSVCLMWYLWWFSWRKGEPHPVWSNDHGCSPSHGESCCCDRWRQQWTFWVECFQANDGKFFIFIVFDPKLVILVFVFHKDFLKFVRY